jgi:AcrR family transcriptional regulator
MKRSENTSRGDSRQLIVASTREELKKNGILGLRVADVAEGAHCSITQIYRFFGDRDGLLAQVLGDMYDEIVSGAFDAYMEKIRQMETLTVDDLVKFLPLPSQPQSMQNQELRMQILATSVNNVQLRQRIEAITKSVYRNWQTAIEEVQRKLPPGVRVDWRVVNIMLLMQNVYYRTLLGEEGFTDEEYLQFLKDKFTLS